jgi:hypothetical protein
MKRILEDANLNKQTFDTTFDIQTIQQALTCLK